MPSVFNLSRRLLLQRAAALASVSIAGAALGGCEWPTAMRPKFGAYPFALGVASGDPVSDGFVIWTRLAPNPFDRASVPDETIGVIWEVASDEAMKTVVQRGEVLARRGLAHAVHVEVRGLPSGRPYGIAFVWRGPMPALSDKRGRRRNWVRRSTVCGLQWRRASTSNKAISRPTTTW